MLQFSCVVILIIAGFSYYCDGTFNDKQKLEIFNQDRALSPSMVNFMEATHIFNELETIGVIFVENHAPTKNILDVFLKAHPQPYVFHSLLPINENKMEEKLQNKDVFKRLKTMNFFIVVPTFNTGKTLEMFLLEVQTIVDIYGKFQFVLPRSEVDHDLQHLFDLLWQVHIVNYVLVFQNGKQIEVIGYNPFANKILNFTEWVSQKNMKVPSLYKDKLNNMYGYKFDIVMMNDPPRNWFENGEFHGEDLENLKTIIAALNATYHLTVYDDYRIINAAIRNNSADLTFARRFAQSTEKELVSPLKPSLLEYVVCAVPNSDPLPQYKQIFTIFSPLLWICLLFFLVVNTVLLQVFQKIFLGHVDVTESAMISLAMFLSTSYIQPKIAKTSTRILLVCWTFFGILIAASFNSQLGSNLVAVRYSAGIKSIEELSRSHLKLGMINGFQTTIFRSAPELAHLQVVTFANIYELGKGMVYREEKIAYIGLKTILGRIAQSKGHDGRNKFLLLDKTLIPGFNVYDAPKHSIWARKIETMLEYNFEADLTSRGIKTPPNAVLDDNEPQSITLYHVLGAYLIWGSGIVVSALAFAIEKYVHKRTM